MLRSLGAGLVELLVLILPLVILPAALLVGALGKQLWIALAFGKQQPASSLPERRRKPSKTSSSIPARLGRRSHLTKQVASIPARLAGWSSLRRWSLKTIQEEPRLESRAAKEEEHIATPEQLARGSPTTAHGAAPRPAPAPGKVGRPPIYATGDWRKPEAAELVKKIQSKGWDITLLSQVQEGLNEAGSVLRMLREKGLPAATQGQVLLVGTGNGSSQFVLARRGELVAIEFATGYRTSTEDDLRSKASAVERILKAAPSSSGGATLDLVVAWGSVYYKCTEASPPNPVNPDKGELEPAQPKERFTAAGFQQALPENTPMLVIRNVRCGPENGGEIFKPHWDVDTQGAGKYVDLGSGKAALVSVLERGNQEKNLKFSINPAAGSKDIEADASEVDTLLSQLCA